jgi:dTDP-4-amino-4,6-dideoxygalactose transaminase
MPEAHVPEKRNLLRARPQFSDRDIAEALRMIETCLRSRSLVMGPLATEFERKFAEAVGVRHAIAVSSGTAALEIGMRCMQLEGREVIVPTETFVASANSVLLAGGRPVFAEVRPETLCLDIDDVTRRITPRTAGVLAVHMAGLVQPDIDALRHLCERRGLFLAEDAAHAPGARIGEKRAGGFGRFGCFSFYPTKLITTGEGGMLTTNDPTIDTLARSYRNHGANPQGADYVRVSANFRMSEVTAALGLVQIAHLEEFVQKRRALARLYAKYLEGIGGLSLPPSDTTGAHVYWNYIVMLPEGTDRAALAKRLGERGVPVAWPYDPPCHLQPVFMRELGSRAGDLPLSERALKCHLALPMHVALSDEDIAYISGALVETLSKAE